MHHDVIIDFLSKFSADLYGSAESAGVLLFLERSKFQMGSQNAPLSTSIKDRRCIFHYSPEFIDMPYDEKAFYTLSEMYKIMHLHVLRERSLNRFYGDDFNKDLFDQASNQVANNEATFFRGVFNFDSINDIEDICRRKHENDEDVETVYDDLFAEQEGQEEEEEEQYEYQQSQGGSQGNSSQQSTEDDADSSDATQGQKEQTQPSSSQELEERIQEALSFVNNLRKERDFEGFDSKDDIDSPGTKAGVGSDDYVFDQDVKAVPTFSKTWTKIIKWELAKSKRQNMDLECNWTNINPRNIWLSMNGLILPQERLKVTDTKAPAFWVFIDVSASCESLWPSFYKIIRSVPADFKVRFFHFAERCKEITKEVKKKNFKLSRNHGVGYGTRFDSIEGRIQQTMMDEDIEYPDYVVVITDGEGEARYLTDYEHPERWMFILKDRNLSWMTGEKCYVILKNKSNEVNSHDYDAGLRLTSFQYMTQEKPCPFWETINNRPKHLPLVVAYSEFVKPGKYEYEVVDKSSEIGEI